MKIQQFEDKHLSHYSYAILSECESQIILIDPSRNPKVYEAYAAENKAAIIAVIETHPHADFVSSHLEFHQRHNAKIYAHSLTGASYPFERFDEGAVINLGKITLSSLHTPGHSPDSICIVLHHNGREEAVFTGDTLFVGDCGRPDLREDAGNQKAKREELAGKLFHSLRDKLMRLPDHVTVYPAHGAGTLCGKGLSTANSSTIGAEKAGNWSLNEPDKPAFIRTLIADQPFIPKYFGYDVELNRSGAPAFEEAIKKVSVLAQEDRNSRTVISSNDRNDLIIIDTRPETEFKKGFLPGSVNIQEGNKFETWLGSIVNPGERYYLAAADNEKLLAMISRTASIGYESFIASAFISKGGSQTMDAPDLELLTSNPDHFTIVDVRNTGEVKAQPIFAHAIHIPLAELRERTTEIPTNKPIMVHCAGGYRSVAASSILYIALGTQTRIYDLGEAIAQFK